LLYSTYLGGESGDIGKAIAIDSSDNAYITGFTGSLHFPITQGVFDTSFNGRNYDVFVAKINSSGTELIYSTYLGGEYDDYGYDIALDNLGNAYITGYTGSSNFPTTPNAFDTSLYTLGFPPSGNQDTFITKLNATGSTLIYSTYLGGEDGDYGQSIAIDSMGNAYITGLTASYLFPTTPGAYDTSLHNSSDAFVSKLNVDGTALIYSTYLGGTDYDFGSGIAVDYLGNAYITGYTDSLNYPITLDAINSTSNGGNRDAFITELNSNGSALLYSTYLGGENDDYGYSLAVDSSGNCYVTGMTSSPNFPTTINAFDTSYNGGCDAFVTKVSLNPYFNTNGEFTDSNDTNYWYFEKYGDAMAPGAVALDTTYGFAVIYQSPGEKGKLTQVFSVPSPGWYTAKAKVWTTIASHSQQQKVYLYLQELDEHNQVVSSGNQVVEAGSGYFDGDWNPKELAISFYAHGTKLAVQLVAINSFDSGEYGSIGIDYIRVTDGAPELLDAIALVNPSFDNGFIGWDLERYSGTATAGIWTTAWSNLILAQVGGQKGKASQTFFLPTPEKNIYASAWVYSDVSSMHNTQKVYLYFYDYTMAYLQVIDNASMILQSGKWTPREWHQLQLVFPSSSQYNSVQLVGINPAANSWAGLYFDEVEVKQ
ncbi:MAG: SBBP repeat-containing protein, partial [bacterium]